MFKRVILTLAAVLIISSAVAYFYFKKQFSAPPVTVTLANNSHPIAFRWLADTLNGQPNPFAAMLLPVRLSGCPRTFYMQFDLGSPYTLFYNGMLQDIRNQYPIPSVQENDGKLSLTNISFTIGNTLATATAVPVIQYKQPAIRWKQAEDIVIIGTIGSDIIHDRTLTINYPLQTIALTENVPDTLTAAVTESFQWKERKVLLPVTIADEKTTIFFDTGSSAFELLTNKETWQRLASKGKPQKKYTVNSWNNKLTAFTAPTDHVITVASASFPLRNVTHIEGASFLQNMLMRFSGIGGMTGNLLFVNSVLIIDTRQQRFGVLGGSDYFAR